MLVVMLSIGKHLFLADFFRLLSKAQIELKKNEQTIAFTRIYIFKARQLSCRVFLVYELLRPIVFRTKVKPLMLIPFHISGTPCLTPSIHVVFSALQLTTFATAFFVWMISSRFLAGGIHSDFSVQFRRRL